MAVPIPSPAVIAHRGASAYAPEHTFAAYDLALELGADALELDVRPLADGQLAVCHDATLLRTCGDPRPLARVAAADLAGLPAETRPVPLADVLHRYAGRTAFLVELKHPKAADLEAVLTAVRAAEVGDRVVLQSFDHVALRALRVLDPVIALCGLYPRGVPGRLLRAGLGRAAEWLTAIAPSAAAVDASLLARAHALGLRVHPYTVNETPELERLAALGADGLITDVPDRARAALAGAARLAA